MSRSTRAIIDLAALRHNAGPGQHTSGYLFAILHNLITDRYRRRPPLVISLDDDVAVDAGLEEGSDERRRDEVAGTSWRCLTALAALLSDAETYYLCSQASHAAALKFVSSVNTAAFEQFLNKLDSGN